MNKDSDARLNKYVDDLLIKNPTLMKILKGGAPTHEKDTKDKNLNSPSDEIIKNLDPTYDEIINQRLEDINKILVRILESVGTEFTKTLEYSIKTIKIAVATHPVLKKWTLKEFDKNYKNSTYNRMIEFENDLNFFFHENEVNPKAPKVDT